MEIEAKFSIRDPETYRALQATAQIGEFAVVGDETQDLHDTYVDTSDRRILAAGYACRQRTLAAGILITLKTLGGSEGPIHRREEEEITLPEVLPPERWPLSAVRNRVQALIAQAPLEPLFSLRQTRRVRTVRQGERLVAELSIDDVILTHGDRTQQYRELEVELKGAGTEADLAAIVARLQAMPGLVAEPLSKFHRGLRFNQATPELPQTLGRAPSGDHPPPRRPGIGPDDTMAGAAQKTLRFHFGQMLAHESGARLGEDNEELHDMRVATRRMRAAFRAFQGYVDVDLMAPYLKGLKRTGRVLGAVRDMDIFREKTQSYVDGFPDDKRPDMVPLMRVWDVEYAHARANLADYLDGKRYGRFKARFGQFLERPFPEALTPASESERGSLRVRDIVPGIVRERLAEVRAYDAGFHQPAVPLTYYHQLRIAAKHLRYLLEYFQEVLGPDAGQAITEIKALQDHLGALQDAVVASARLSNFLTWGTWEGPRGEGRPWTGMPITDPDVARYLEFRQAEIRRLVETFPAAWERFTSSGFDRLIANALSTLAL